jgi:hypothetical protein
MMNSPPVAFFQQRVHFDCDLRCSSVPLPLHRAVRPRAGHAKRAVRPNRPRWPLKRSFQWRFQVRFFCH